MPELNSNFVEENFNFFDRFIALYRAVRDRVLSLFRRLLGKGANVVGEEPVLNQAADDREPATLLQAARNHDLSKVGLLLQEGANVDFIIGGQTALYKAVFHRDIDMVKLLLENGANVDLSYETPLQLASKSQVVSKNQDTEIVRLLLKFGANVNLVKRGDSALYYATKSQNPEIVKLLLDQGANVNFIGYHKATALYRAVDYNNTEIVELLLKNGANPELLNIYGKTALHLAVEKGRIHKAKIIINFILLRDQLNEKPDFVQGNQNLSAYWDQILKEIKKFSETIRFPLIKLLYDTPIKLVDTYNLKLAFINKLTQVLFGCEREESFPVFSGLLEFKVKELELLVKERQKYLKSLDGSTLSSKEENKEISLNNDCLRQIASYLPITDIKNLLKACLFASKSKSANVDLDTLTSTTSCTRTSSC